MTRTIYDQLEQGSPEWMAARCGLLTASTIGKLITPTGKLADNDTSRGLIETLVAERLTGVVDYVHPTFDMQRGTLDESYARDFYAEQYGVQVDEIGFAVRDIEGYKLGASPDGLIGDMGGLEIKSRRPKAQIRAFLSNSIPAENLAQIHCNMLVLDRQWWQYVSYAGNWPLYVKTVERDPNWDALLTAALKSFSVSAAEMVRSYELESSGLPIAPYIDHFPEIEIEL